MLLMLLMIETAMMKSESLLQVANALEETWLPWCKRPSSTACRMPTNERMNRIESNLCVGVRNRFLGKIDEEQYCKTNLGGSSGVGWSGHPSSIAPKTKMKWPMELADIH
jgi:hypothetical protein